jgi:hypothetical protein
MIKDLKVLQHTIGEKAYHMLLDPTSTLNEAKQALFHFLGIITTIENQISSQQEAAKTEPIVTCEPPTEA